MSSSWASRLAAAEVPDRDDPDPEPPDVEIRNHVRDILDDCDLRTLQARGFLPPSGVLDFKALTRAAVDQAEWNLDDIPEEVYGLALAGASQAIRAWEERQKTDPTPETWPEES